MWDPIHVVHVVQDSVVRAPQKYHAPLTITVNHGFATVNRKPDSSCVYLQSRR